MMDGLFNPHRVAVIGASTNPANSGRGIIWNLKRLGFRGEVFPVGRSGGDLDGTPIYLSVDQIPGTIDLAVIIVPAQFVATTLDECGRKGAQWAVIPSSGFREYEDGRVGLEDELLAVARYHGIRFVGPNCLGVSNFAIGLTTSFSPLDLEGVRPGPISVVAQSGALGQSFCRRLSELGPGVNKLISVGNKLDLDEADYLEYLAADPSTEVICMYLEDIRRGRDFMAAARRCPKPVLVHKGGVTAAGRRAAKSHTAALAANDALVDAAFRQAGVVRMHGVRPMAIAAGVMRLPKLRGNRLAVFATSGGASVVISDFCETHGFTLPSIDQDVLQSIEEHSRAGVIHLTNPLDLSDVREPHLFAEAVRRVLALPYVDGAIAVFPFGNSGSFLFQDVTRRITAAMKQISTELDKPVILSSRGGTVGVMEAIQENDFPIIVEYEDTVDAMLALLRYSRRFWESPPEGAAVFGVKAPVANTVSSSF